MLRGELLMLAKTDNLRRLAKWLNIKQPTLDAKPDLLDRKNLLKFIINKSKYDI